MASIITTANERYVLACCLNDSSLVWEVNTILDPTDFSLDANVYIFTAVKKLVENDQDLDESSIVNFLGEQALDVVKGISPDRNPITYLQLIKKSPHSEKNLSANVERIKRGSVRRQLVKRFENLTTKFVNDETDWSVEELIEISENEIVDVGFTNEERIQTNQVAIGLDSFLEERAKFPVEIPGIRTGFNKLDKVIGGLKEGQLTVLAARPKIGKTTMLLNWAKHIAIDQNIPVLMLDTEMETQEIMTRLVAMMSNVEEQKIINGYYAKDEEEKEKVLEAANVLSKAPLYHIYLAEFTLEKVVSFVRRYKVQHDIGVLFFDYIKLPDNSNLRNAQEYQHLGYLTTGLKNKIAGKLKIPVVTAGQLNRLAVGAEVIDTNQIAGSDRILHYCNHLLSLRRRKHSELEKNPNIKDNLVLSILASRNAESGMSFGILFKQNKLQMYEINRLEGEEIEEDWNQY